MIHSMTAYARSEIVRPPYTVRVEIRSFNSRHLDIAIHLPRNQMALESKLQAMVAEKLNRGRVEIRVQIDEGGSKTSTFTIDEPLATAYYQALVDLKHHLGLEGDVTLDHLMAIGDIIQPAETINNNGDCWEIIQTCLSSGLSDLADMRRNEGELLAVDINDRLTFIENSLSRIEKISEGLLRHYQKRLTDRIRALTDEQAVIDPDRMAREAALLADRSDISEEMVRAASHLTHFRELMAAEPSAGRKLNFLLQELHREFNTMGSKTAKAEVGHIIVDVKSEIEKIREQVQNVE